MVVELDNYYSFCSFCLPYYGRCHMRERRIHLKSWRFIIRICKCTEKSTIHCLGYITYKIIRRILCVAKSTFIVSHITFIFRWSISEAKALPCFPFAPKTSVKCKYSYTAIEIYYTVMLRICNTCQRAISYTNGACMHDKICMCDVRRCFCVCKMCDVLLFIIMIVIFVHLLLCSLFNLYFRL